MLTGNTTFQGVLYADGKTISGDVTAPIGTAPFTHDANRRGRVRSGAEELADRA